MAAGEGIETMLSLRCALPGMPMAAALSAAHLAASIPEPLRRLYVVRDDDPAGDGAHVRSPNARTTIGIETLALSPILEDFNEDLRLRGLDAVRASVRVQLSPEDVPRFMEQTAVA